QPHTAQDRLRIDNESIPLSGQETAVVRMIAEGLFYKEIAIKLKIAESTVKTYVKNICNKINVRSRTEIAVKYIKWQQMDR
ncbi:MAG: LuxR family transcriptional regulator, partial [Verrucomicrobiaceae bacterium]